MANSKHDGGVTTAGGGRTQNDAVQSTPARADSLSDPLADHLSDSLSDPLRVQFSIAPSGPGVDSGGGDDGSGDGPGDPPGGSSSGDSPLQMDDGGGSSPGSPGDGDAPGGSSNPFEGWGPAGLGALQRSANGAVQRDGPGGTARVHNLAAEGLRGSSTSLPHLETIQHSFGSHDVSGIQAHVGGPAKSAAEGMGANAYATGGSVAFKSNPDLHTAAHEAAHVVQQEQGVSLSNGVGRRGDRYESAADAVADAVVQGRSADSLLGGPGPASAGRSSGGSTVQRLVQFDDELSPEQVAAMNAAKAKANAAKAAANAKYKAVHGQAKAKLAMLEALDTGPKTTFLNNYTGAWDEMTGVLEQAEAAVAEMEANHEIASGIAIAVICGLTVGVGAEALLVGTLAKKAATKLGPRLAAAAKVGAKAAAEATTERAEQLAGDGLDAAQGGDAAAAAKDASGSPQGTTPDAQALELEKAMKDVYKDFETVVDSLGALHDVSNAAGVLALAAEECKNSGTSAALGGPDEVQSEVPGLEAAGAAAQQVASGTPFAKAEGLKTKVESTATTETRTKITFDLWMKWLETASVTYVMQDVVWNKLKGLGIIGPGGLFGDVGPTELIDAVRMRARVEQYIGTVQLLDYPNYQLSQVTLDGETYPVSIVPGSESGRRPGPATSVLITGTSSNNYTWGADASLVGEPAQDGDNLCTEDVEAGDMDESQIEQWEQEELGRHVGTMTDLAEIHGPNSGYIVLDGIGYGASSSGGDSFEASDGFVRVTGYSRDTMNRGPRFATVLCQAIVNGMSHMDDGGNCDG